MYSIDPKKLIIKNATEIVHDEIDHRPNPYDLKNQNTYAASGELIEEAPMQDYDKAFKEQFFDINPIYLIEDFLNHHFERTPDKKLFLKHIGRQIILWFDRPIAKHQAIKKEILQWVDQKEKEILETANPNNSPIGNDLDDRFFRYKEKFTKAEKWAINNSFIDESDRRWIKPKGRLATFLIILQQKSIIHTPSRNLKKNDIEKYFTDRYKLGELLGDSFKWKGKADQYEKEFSDMLLPTN